MAGGDLKALRNRLRAASGPDKELGHALATWLAGNTAPDEWPAIAMLPYYAMSNGIEAVGAALALCERKLPGAWFRIDRAQDRPETTRWRVELADSHEWSWAPTAPLAILLALLEAMIGKETEDA